MTYEHAVKQVLSSIGEASGLYHRLVLLIAPSGKGKTKVLQEVSRQSGVAVVNLNLELSRMMLELTQRQRVLELPRILNEIIAEAANHVVIFDNTEMLFDINLKQDPLRLLQGASRNRTVVASWNGAIDNGYITYAAPGHPEYRRYSVHGVLFTSL